MISRTSSRSASSGCCTSHNTEDNSVLHSILPVSSELPRSLGDNSESLGSVLRPSPRIQNEEMRAVLRKRESKLKIWSEELRGMVESGEGSGQDVTGLRRLLRDVDAKVNGLSHAAENVRRCGADMILCECESGHKILRPFSCNRVMLCEECARKGSARLVRVYTRAVQRKAENRAGRSARSPHNTSLACS